MLYLEELFSVSFEEEEITSNPIPYGKPCRRSIEKTRYVAIARIHKLEPQFFLLEEITIVILPGKDEATEEKKKKITTYTQSLARKRYATLQKEDFIITIELHISSLLQDAALWMPFKFMRQQMETTVESMFSFLDA